MSINDLTSMDLTPVLLILFIVALITAPIGIAIGKKSNNQIYGEDEYDSNIQEKNAKIIARRSAQHPVSPTITVNTVVFELSDGSRVELAIKDATAYGIMVEGDCGILKYQGKKFISFDRSVNNEV